jgi:hypothetical protein
VNGRLIVTGGHPSIEGLRRDHLRTNSAIILKWALLRFLQSDVKPRHAIEVTMQALAVRGWRGSSGNVT